MEDHHFKLSGGFQATFSFLGERWNGVIILTLMSGSKRFKELARLIPSISDTVLTTRINALESTGVLVRKVSPTTPMLIEYELTPKGQQALEIAIQQIKSWSEKWIE